MRIIKFLLSFSVCLMFINLSFGQWSDSRWKKNRADFGGGIGISNFMGDLGGGKGISKNSMKDFDFKASRPTFSFHYRYFLLKTVAVRGNLIYGYVAGKDKYSSKDAEAGINRYNRGLKFRSPIIELSAQGEWYFYEQVRKGHVHSLRGVKGMKNIDIAGFLFAGIGGFYFNPRNEVDGKWYSLRKIGTEGQGYYESRPKYSPFQVCIPFGIGLKHNFDKTLSIELAYGFRKTFTDYIDDVSKTYVDPKIFDQEYKKKLANPAPNEIPQTNPGQIRGNPNNDDAYMFALVTVHYKIPTAGYKKHSRAQKWKGTKKRTKPPKSRR